MQLATGGALMKCSFGAAPAPLTVLPTGGVMVNLPVASIMDNKPFVNVPTFGTCMSLANPTVAAATSAAMGVLTPMPCIPATSAPWAPGNPKVLVGSMPAVDSSCMLMCNWGGVIQLTYAGQVKVNC